MSLLPILPAALLGGLIGLDVVSFPQAMLSRPIVGATLAGALGGEPIAGLLAGAALEMLAMEMLPVGASRYPEWGSASVVGGTIAAGIPAPSPAALVLGVLVALVAAWLGGWSMHFLRRANGAWSVRARPRLEAGDARVVTALQLRGLAADFARGALLTFAVLAAARWAVPRVEARIGTSVWLLTFLLAALGAAVTLSALWRLAPPVARLRWAAAIALAGGVLVVVSR